MLFYELSIFPTAFHWKQRPGRAFPFNIMEVGKGLNGRKILLPETWDVLLNTLLKECVSVRKINTFDKMFLKQLVSKGECEKYVIGSKDAFNGS